MQKTLTTGGAVLKVLSDLTVFSNDLAPASQKYCTLQSAANQLKASQLHGIFAPGADLLIELQELGISAWVNAFSGNGTSQLKQLIVKRQAEISQSQARPR